MLYIGIDIGGTKVGVGLTDEKGKIIVKNSIPTMGHREYGEIVKDTAHLTRDLIKASGVGVNDIKAIGLGVPGIVDDKSGRIVRTVNLNLNNAPVTEELKKYFHIPVFLENDANAAALGESRLGSAAGARFSVTVTLGTGVGSGIITDGRIYSGFNGTAGEFGHMVINLNAMDGKGEKREGLKCTCGRIGCWETYASATALVRQTREAAAKDSGSIIHELADGDLSKINAKVPFDAAKKGDKTSLGVIRTYIGYVAEGLANVINILQPEVLVIGGGISKEGEYLLAPLRERTEEKVYSCEGIPRTVIKAALLGNDAGISGAALMASLKVGKAGEK